MAVWIAKIGNNIARIGDSLIKENVDELPDFTSNTSNPPFTSGATVLNSDAYKAFYGGVGSWNWSIPTEGPSYPDWQYCWIDFGSRRRLWRLEFTITGCHFTNPPLGGCSWILKDEDSIVLGTGPLTDNVSYTYSNFVTFSATRLYFWVYNPNSIRIAKLENVSIWLN